MGALDDLALLSNRLSRARQHSAEARAGYVSAAVTLAGVLSSLRAACGEYRDLLNSAILPQVARGEAEGDARQLIAATKVMTALITALWCASDRPDHAVLRKHIVPGMLEEVLKDGTLVAWFEQPLRESAVEALATRKDR